MARKTKQRWIIYPLVAGALAVGLSSLKSNLFTKPDTLKTVAELERCEGIEKPSGIEEKLQTVKIPWKVKKEPRIVMQEPENITKEELKQRKEALKEILKGRYRSYRDEEYPKFLKYKDSLEFAKILGDKFNSLYLEEYTNFLKTGKALELVKEGGSEFASCYVNEYVDLLKRGIPPKAIVKISGWTLDDIISDLESKEMPEELIPYFTHSPEEYSIIAAGHNPILGTDHEKIREYIKEQLAKRPHAFRKNTDYKEKSSQVDSVENINILYLIKEYIDYFEDEDNRREISRFIREDLKDSFSEHGGITIFNGDEYKFVKINPRERRIKNLEDNSSYNYRDWIKYIGCVGGFHFHATKEEDREYSGPSGNAKSDLKILNGDISSLIRANEVNPYRIECVITKLKDNKFNPDLYFRDVRMELLGGKLNTKKITVLDLGIYDMVKD